MKKLILLPLFLLVSHAAFADEIDDILEYYDTSSPPKVSDIQTGSTWNCHRVTTHYPGNSGGAEDIKTALVFFQSPDGTFRNEGALSPNFEDRDSTNFKFRPDGEFEGTYYVIGALGAAKFHITRKQHLVGRLDFCNGACRNFGAMDCVVDPNVTKKEPRSNGPLDLSYSETGIRGTAPLPSNWGNLSDFVTLSDGSLLAGAYSRTPQNKYAVGITKYKIDGMLDSSFGSNGILSFDTNEVAWASPGFVGFRILPTLDGKFIVVSVRSVSRDSYYDESIAIARFLPNGVLDATYGKKGRTIVHLTKNGEAVINNAVDAIVQDNGQVTLLLEHGAWKDTNSRSTSLVQLDANGFLSNQFGNHGIAELSDKGTFTPAHLSSVDNHIIVMGERLNYGLIVHRILPDGSYDKSFGNLGTASAAIGYQYTRYSSQFSVTGDRDGKITVSIGFQNSSGVRSVGLIRMLSNGALDPSLGNGGIALPPISGKDNDQWTGTFSRTVIQPDGKILSTLQWIDQKAFTLVRQNPDGSSDSSFGEGGSVRSIFPKTSSALAPWLDPSGNIYVWGQYGDALGVAKYFNR